MFGLSPLVGSMPQVAMSLQKHIFDHIRLKAEETVEADLFRQYGTDPDRMVSSLQREAAVALKVAEFFQEVKAMQEQLSGAGQEQPDPIVELKKQELAQSAERDKAKAVNDQATLQLDQQREQNDVSNDQAKLAAQQNIAATRDQIALLKLNQPKAPNGNFQ
jgi:hypothetical protein